MRQLLALRRPLSLFSVGLWRPPSNKVSRKDLPRAVGYFYFVAGFHIERTSILSLKMGTFLKRTQAISDGVCVQTSDNILKA